MIDSSRSTRLNEYLGPALCASNQLVAQVYGPAEPPEPRRDGHVLLLLLSPGGATAVDDIAERLHLAPAALALALGALESEELIERADAGREAGVALTRKGARVRERVGKREVRRRLHLLKPEIEALRDLLHRTLRAVEGEAGVLRAA